MTSALHRCDAGPMVLLPWRWRLWSERTRPSGGVTNRDSRRGGTPAVAAGTWAPELTLGRLYHARRVALVRLAVLMVDDLPTAEDIVQDVFVALHRRHGQDLSTIDDPHAYLTTGVMNAARSTLRRRRIARAYVPPRQATTPAAEEQMLQRHGDREIIDALAALTIRQRQVVVLRYWSELSEAEIADTLEVSRGTVKSTASKALSKLRGLVRQRS